MKRVSIIGGGLSGLSAACYLAKEGYEVTIYEKLPTVGGRARVFENGGFKFDIGPTFYWMPDIFERFFSDFNKRVSDYYQLVRLDPGYQIYFGENNSVSVPASLERIYDTFESIEPGSGKYLRKFLERAGFNYNVAINKVVEKPGKSPFELIMPETVSRVDQFVRDISSSVRANIKDERLRQILEFPVIFLGAKPSNTPLFYCFMNYADMVLGTWHVMGGMYRVVEAMRDLALELGAKIITNAHVERIVSKGDKITGIRYTNTQNKEIKNCETDFIIATADYHFSETLLDQNKRNYSERYWQKRVFAPSALLFYVGFNTKLSNVSHHTLFFDADFKEHAETIYDKPRWPSKPLFYASFPSITDSEAAPEGKEAGIFLIPIAAGLKDNQALRETYFMQIMDRMEKVTGCEVSKYVKFKRSYSVKDFISDYHAYKGNAYGLSNILTQTAFLKPKMENRHLKNLLYAGQLTVPGPGVPPSIISGRVAARLAVKKLRNG